MIYLQLFILLLSLVVPLQVRADLVTDLHNVSVPAKPDGSAYSVEEVQRAIIGGVQKRGWTAKLEGDGKIIARILVRSRHYAEVEITFTAAAYSITYRDSRELDYDKETRDIHGNYNKWVKILSNTIQQEFGLM
ncbi:MAG: hypothetical protein HOP18_22915 [Deltaproteobacteria bacterium]|nr:hypothetical protein [Deltaproteobacteria bacterium]